MKSKNILNILNTSERLHSMFSNKLDKLFFKTMGEAEKVGKDLMDIKDEFAEIAEERERKLLEFHQEYIEKVEKLHQRQEKQKANLIKKESHLQDAFNALYVELNQMSQSVKPGLDLIKEDMNQF